MPTLMPSLFKYFAIVGGILFAGLIGLNALLEPGGPGPKLVRDTTKVVVRVDPHASKVERLRAEEAALKAAEKANPEAQPVIVTEPLRLPPPDPLPVTQAAAQPSAPVAQPSAPAQQVSAPVALTNTPTEDEAATAVRAAQEKIAADKARKKRLARERARTRAMQEASAASRHQDQIYYGYAPRPAYGPFGHGQGGYGGGGWGRRW
jgi:hypothetical protein